KEHPQPKGMKQYKWKPWTQQPERPVDPNGANNKRKSKTSKKSSPKTTITPVPDMTKKQLLNALNWEHPTATLNVGTLSANCKEALQEDPALQQEVLHCIREAVRAASQVKRACQGLIGRYIERLSKPGVFQSSDRDVLDCICPRISPSDIAPAAESSVDQDDKPQDTSDLDEKGDNYQEFIATLLRYLYSGNYPKTTGVGNA
ncbi:hypothetical protein BGZ75_002526, partial [Mortierella antarctica]